MRKRIASHQGVRHLHVRDQLPACEVVINTPAYRLEEVAANKTVLDIGCGFGGSREVVEGVAGTWFGLERHAGGAEYVIGDAESLPVKAEAVDVVLMDAVLEHVPDVSLAFAEIARVLRPGGEFVGYAAFMECFHEISYSHLSFRALEHLAEKNRLKLRRIGGGGSFGIDYHVHVLLHPLPTKALRKLIARAIRVFLSAKAAIAARVIGMKRHLNHPDVSRLRKEYFELECLRQSTGFTFLIQKPTTGAVPLKAP